MINNALRGKQNLNYKIYGEKKLMNRIDYSSSVMNSPPKLYLPFEQVKNTIQYPN